MQVVKQIEATAITSFVTLLGHGDIFSRILAECRRVNNTHPNVTGADKRHIVLMDLNIIFEDLVVPVAESVIRLLLELAVAWLKRQV
jgi:hypothetical protein